ncbi:hypothetical protein Sxan_22730 [Streptomyces xanthophaeus]|uniref:Uncharacterized protein n=1 Tax=Streptomyces xanthophaeus TaxID=67385 RepID=A0A919H039_9ACTN|nr:hypothetical protein Sxan_22730 [Streptomyces xanthophaeus]
MHRANSGCARLVRQVVTRVFVGRPPQEPGQVDRFGVTFLHTVRVEQEAVARAQVHVLDLVGAVY